MKIFTKKGILQKTIILITMVLSINFIMPTYSHADMGGVLLTPVTDLVAAIGDVVVGLLQGCMNLSTDENFFANNNAFMVDGGDFDTTKYPKSKITGDEQTKENISTDDLDKGWFSNGDDYQIPVSKL